MKTLGFYSKKTNRVYKSKSGRTQSENNEAKKEFNQKLEALKEKFNVKV